MSFIHVLTVYFINCKLHKLNVLLLEMQKDSEWEGIVREYNLLSPVVLKHNLQKAGFPGYGSEIWM